MPGLLIDQNVNMMSWSTQTFI